MISLIRCLRVLLFIVVLIPAIEANDTLSDGNFWEFSSCTLQCANGGQCHFLSGTADILARIAQSNTLVETCVCDPGYFGHTCQYTIEECNPNNDTTTPIDSSWGCDCSLADSLSNFAGRMCRKPITEYCSRVFDIHKPISFCTNGGRCRQDIIGGALYRGNGGDKTGCICHEDFHGPHCEFAGGTKGNDNDIGHENVAMWENNGLSSLKTTGSHNTTKRSTGYTGVILLSVFGPIFLGLLTILVHKNREGLVDYFKPDFNIWRRMRNKRKLLRTWNESTRTSNSNACIYYLVALAAYANDNFVWRRSTEKNDLSRTWDRSADDPSIEVHKHCDSFDEDTSFDDEGVIFPDNKYELRTIHEEKEVI